MIIDVSEHNGALNWESLKTQIEGAIIRCGYGSNITAQDDKYWARNVSECERLGIHYGVYLYSYAATEAAARSEAEHVLRLMSGHNPELPIFYDLEEAKYGTAARANYYAFEHEIKAAGFRCGLYTGEYYYNQYMLGTAADYRWIAKYGTNNGQPQKKPTLSDGANYQLWQFTSKWMNQNMDASEIIDRSVFATMFATTTAAAVKKSVDEIAAEVIAGKWGNGTDRKNRLQAAGYDYNAVQACVDSKLSASVKKKSVDEVAREVIAGKWGSGVDRRNRLDAAGYDYNAVQSRVNALLSGGSKAPSKSVTEIAREVIAGKWGNGSERRRRIQAAGYNYAAVQSEVNRLLKR